MILKRLSASFGGLQNARLKLAPGLNIVEAPNETGKSTWCAFIRAMLYGINTSERGKDGFLPEKTKYRPWSGQAMEGIMEVEANGKGIAIQRTALGNSPMKKLDVRYTGTGEEVIALMHENLGETLTGVPEAVFMRSAFIRQAGMKISQTGELEQRIAALVSSGDENISYTETANTLGAWQRKRRHNKTGQMPAIEAEIAEIDQTLARLKEVSEVYNEISLDLDRMEERRRELEADQSTHLELERRIQRQKIADAKRKVQDLDWEIIAHKKKLGENFSKESLQSARKTFDKLGSLTMQNNEAKAKKDEAEKELLLIEEERFNTGFEGKSTEEAQLIVGGAAMEEEAAKNADAFNRQKYTIPMGALPVLGLAALAASIVAELPLAWLTVIAFIAMGVVGIMFYRKWHAAKLLVKRSEETLIRLRAPDMEALRRELERYETLSSKAQELKEKFDAANAASEMAMQEMDNLKHHLEQAIHTFAPDASDIAEALSAMTEIERLAERQAIAEREKEAAVHLVETLVEAYDGDPSEPVPPGELTLPIRSRSETSYDLKRMEKELDTLKNSHAMAMGEVRALGDPVVLGAKRGALTSRLAELTKQYEALALAQEVLTEADAEIGMRFSPLLGKQAGYYLDRLTDGEYKRVVFDRNLTPSAERQGESVSREILYLSGGTIDQIYLALRLAICDLTFPKEKACPIILDDALISFDDIRLGSALTLLKELAAHRQIILFSCQKREAAFFKGDHDVHVANLRKQA